MRVFMRYSTLMVFIIALYSCEGGVKYADKYGFLPGNDALANSEAFQRCLDGGGKIVVRKEGVYDVCRTLLLDSGTDLSFADGVILSRAKDPEGVIAKHVFLNRGALTREYDKDITITGLNIRCNDLYNGTDIPPIGNAYANGAGFIPSKRADPRAGAQAAARS